MRDEPVMIILVVYLCNMKWIYLVRHAKSSWSNCILNDFDRPLNERGKKDAPEMARRLLAKINDGPSIITSPAVRASETAKEFGRVMQCGSVIDNDRLYHASYETILEVIGDIDDSIENVMTFCHNPGITDFANQIPNVNIDNVPTCGILGIESKVNKWQDLTFSSMALSFFLFPKMNGDE